MALVIRLVLMVGLPILVVDHVVDVTLAVRPVLTPEIVPAVPIISIYLLSMTTLILLVWESVLKASG